MTPTVSVFSICRLHLNRVVHLKDRTSGVRRHRDMNGDISKGCFKPAAWGKLSKENRCVDSAYILPMILDRFNPPILSIFPY